MDICNDIIIINVVFKIKTEQALRLYLGLFLDILFILYIFIVNTILIVIKTIEGMIIIIAVKIDL